MNEIKVEHSENSKEVNGSWKEKAWREFKSISLILIIVLGFRSVFFEPFRIPSGSMIPSLMIGDFILVNKMSYGFKVPFSDWFSDPIYIGEQKNPKRGDVIVFKFPKDKSINYIKRVIGVPGDTIEMINKEVFVNGEKIKTVDISSGPEGAKIKGDMDEKFKPYNLKYFRTKTGNHEHYTQVNQDNFYNSDFSKRVIPNGKFFVMGDNRDFSSDSRFWGYVSHELIKGEAIFVWFSMILPFSEHDFKFRPWRIGTKIE